ncbi:MAG: DUF1707 domain-containing protein [Solirubrobacteraceae bacterium]
MTEENKPALLVGDADRERGITLLRDAVVDGRLTLEEFSDRVGAVQLARTEHDLEAQIADLPSQATPSALSTTLSHRVIFSKLVRRGPWELGERSEYRSIFSTVHLDLRHAKLHGDVVEMEIYNLFGTVTLIVPEGITVNVDGGGMFASQVVESPSAAPVPGAPTLRIRIKGPGGTLCVRSSDVSQ